MLSTPVNNPPDSVSLEVEVLVDPQVDPVADPNLIAGAVVATANYRRFDQGEVGVRVCSDETIREINLRHLQHDYPTDVISFGYVCDCPSINGEIIVSVDTARRRSAELGWNTKDELLLYVVHGILHLTGMNDVEVDDRLRMRQAEKKVMTKLGIDQIVHFGADTPRPSSLEESQ